MRMRAWVAPKGAVGCDGRLEGGFTLLTAPKHEDLIHHDAIRLSLMTTPHDRRGRRGASILIRWTGRWTPRSSRHWTSAPSRSRSVFLQLLYAAPSRLLPLAETAPTDDCL
jgi:hypothetical protein